MDRRQAGRGRLSWPAWREDIPSTIRYTSEVLGRTRRSHRSGTVSFQKRVDLPYDHHCVSERSTTLEAERLLRQRAALADFGAAALASTDLDGVLAEGARLCAEGLGVPYCKVLEYRPNRRPHRPGWRRLAAGRGRPRRRPRRRRQPRRPGVPDRSPGHRRGPAPRRGDGPPGHLRRAWDRLGGQRAHARQAPAALRRAGGGRGGAARLRRTRRRLPPWLRQGHGQRGPRPPPPRGGPGRERGHVGAAPGAAAPCPQQPHGDHGHAPERRARRGGRGLARALRGCPAAGVRHGVALRPPARRRAVRRRGQPAGLPRGALRGRPRLPRPRRGRIALPWRRAATRCRCPSTPAPSSASR